MHGWQWKNNGDQYFRWIYVEMEAIWLTLVASELDLLDAFIFEYKISEEKKLQPLVLNEVWKSSDQNMCYILCRCTQINLSTIFISVYRPNAESYRNLQFRAEMRVDRFCVCDAWRSKE